VSLESWRDSRLVVEHETSRQEIQELLGIVTTDLQDARVEELSLDRRLACCYGALLTAARAALRASGYRVPKSTPSRHYYAIQSLQYTVGLDSHVLRQIESMGKKRAMADYVRVGEVSESMVEEGISFAEEYCERIIDWIRREHPSLTEAPG
jgi:uncharacterized protein (UPF0332 family)